MRPPAPQDGSAPPTASLVVRLLRARGPMTQAELARAQRALPGHRVQPRRASCATTAGWPTRAAAAPTLALSRAAGVAVGIDFGHSHVRVAIADLGHTVLAEASEPLDVDHAAAEGIELAGRLVERLLDEVGARRRAGHRRRHGPARAAAPRHRRGRRLGDHAGLDRHPPGGADERAPRAPRARRERREPGRAGRDRLGRRPRLLGPRVRQGGDRGGRRPRVRRAPVTAARAARRGRSAT